ncbi:MAG: hypothetical protein Tsb002_20530 [Wenzhouxiangellaceae bacterium]
MLMNTWKMLILVVLLCLGSVAMAEVNSGTGAPQDADTVSAILDWLLGLLP